MGLPDVVYVVREGEKNEELRFSLRSLALLPHGRVWLAGHKPKWLHYIGHIPNPQGHKKWPNAIGNIRAAVEHPDVAETFVMFNDDFFVTDPIDRFPTLHHGPVRDLDAAQPEAKGEYARRMKDTLAYCGPDALAYDQHHVPMLFDRAKLAEVFAQIGGEMLYRTVYGNVHQVGGVWHPNVKVGMQPKDVPPPFISTNDTSFRTASVGRRIRSLFPDPSRYEA